MPSGVDMADAMQVVTEVEYIMASIGLRRFLPHSPDDLISLTSQVPSSAIAERIAAIAAGQVDGHVSDVGEPLAGRCHRPFGHVVALVGGGGEGLGEQLEGQSGAATDVHDPGSGREAIGHAVQ